MTDAEDALPAPRSHAAVLNEAASRYAVYGVLIASGALIIATLLVAWLSDGSISVRTIANAQQYNIALWCMDAMPFIFALWGQYASSRMAREARGIISDRTRAFSEALEEARHTNQAKTDFFARISHELRTPLNAIVGMADMLVEPASPEEARWYAQTVRESAQNLLTLINDILDIAKIEAGRMELEEIEFDLRECVRGALTLLHAQAVNKGLRLTSLVAPEIPERAVGDPGRMRQIIINLVGNAIKYTNEGEVVFTLSRTGPPDTHEQVLRIEVADTGIGIPTAAQRDLFKPYRQAGTGAARQGGTGLGLAITRELVESMHGRIGVESQSGKGSTFWCTLRLQRAAQLRTAPPRLPELEGRRVLLADPNEQSRQALADQIRSEGMRVQAVANSTEAIAAVRIAAVKKRPYDIIVLDMFLSETSGEELGQRFLSDPEADGSLVAIITSAGARGDVERMAREGFAAYLTRPLPKDDLGSLFQRILALRELDAEERRRIGVVTRHSQHDPAGSDERRKRVLLVEDSEAGRAVSLRQLATLGLAADIAVTGEEALEAAGRTHYGAILLDLQLPDMNGTQVLRRLRQNIGTPEQCPVVITTAGATDAEHKRCRELGANRILTKPVDLHELRSVLAQWVTFEPTPRPGEDEQEEEAPGPQPIDPELAEIFLHESDRRILSIRKASTDVEGLQHIANEAHTLKSTSRYAGDAVTSLAAEEVENLAREGKLENLNTAIDELFRAYGKLRKRLREQLVASATAQRDEPRSA